MFSISKVDVRGVREQYIIRYFIYYSLPPLPWSFSTGDIDAARALFFLRHLAYPAYPATSTCKIKPNIYSLKGYFQSWCYALKVTLLAVGAISKDPS